MFLDHAARSLRLQAVGGDNSICLPADIFEPKNKAQLLQFVEQNTRDPTTPASTILKNVRNQVKDQFYVQVRNKLGSKAYFEDVLGLPFPPDKYSVADFFADADSIKDTARKLALQGWSPWNYFEALVHIWASVVILPYAARNAQPITRRLVENYLTFLCDEMLIPRGSILLEDTGSRKHSISKLATSLMKDKLRNFEGMKDDNEINRRWWHGNIGIIFQLEPDFIKKYLSELIIRQSKPRLSNGHGQCDKRLYQIKVNPGRFYTLRSVTVNIQSSCGNKLKDVLGKASWNQELLPPAPAPLLLLRPAAAAAAPPPLQTVGSRRATYIDETSTVSTSSTTVSGTSSLLTSETFAPAHDGQAMLVDKGNDPAEQEQEDPEVENEDQAMLVDNSNQAADNGNDPADEQEQEVPEVENEDQAMLVDNCNHQAAEEESQDEREEEGMIVDEADFDPLLDLEEDLPKILQDAMDEEKNEENAAVSIIFYFVL
jgi:hypothetical protein